MYNACYEVLHFWYKFKGSFFVLSKRLDEEFLKASVNVPIPPTIANYLKIIRKFHYRAKCSSSPLLYWLNKTIKFN